MRAAPSIPSDPAQLTPAWLTNVLESAGLDASVADLDVTAIGTGQMATSLRLLPTYRQPSLAPASFVLKIASSDPNSRAAGARGAYLREVRFYQELASHVPVATPKSYWSAIDQETNDFALLLEDMHPAEQGDQIAGARPEHVLQAAINIAGLHAPRWNDPSLYELDWLTTPRSDRAASAQEIHEILGMVTPGFIERYNSRLDERHIELLRWFANNAGDWLLDDHGRFALCHGDHRLDNLLFDATNTARPVTVVDWQTVAVRNPAADTAYLLGTSVEADVRRTIEQDVLDSYHQALCGFGIDDYDRATCFEDYRRQTPHSLLLSVLGSMLTVQTDRGDDMFMAMLHRSTEQMLDLDLI